MPDVTVRFSEMLEIRLKNWDWDPRPGSNGLLDRHGRWSWLPTFIHPDGKESKVSSEPRVRTEVSPLDMFWMREPRLETNIHWQVTTEQ